METLASLDLTLPKLGLNATTVRIVKWTSADPFPDLGRSVGVDTETLKFDLTPQIQPPLVVLGVYDGEHHVCYIVYWQDAPAFMRELNRRDIEQRYFNLGFDEIVLDNEDEEQSLLTAIDQNRVVDMSIRKTIDDIATLGWIRHSTGNLAGASKFYLRLELDKGDGSDESARLSFRRVNDDGTPYVITQEQAKYLMYDCLATWGLGEVIPQSPIDPQLGIRIEYAHTKGMVVLAHISANGIDVDEDVFSAMEAKLHYNMDRAREDLISFGFPDPYHDDSTEMAEVRAELLAAYSDLIGLFGLTSELTEPPSKMSLRYAILYLWNHEGVADEMPLMANNIKTVMEFDRKSFRKHEAEEYNKICEDYGVASVDGMSRAVCMQAFVAAMFRSVMDQYISTGTYLFKAAVAAGDAVIDAHPWWQKDAPKIGPKKFFQERVTKLLEKYPGLKLDRTPKSGDIKLTLKDMWKLDDVGDNDKFLRVYTKFKHCEKLLSTYLNRAFIIDGKVHPRFTNLVRTGRVSCSKPNIQNIPSREIEYPIKNVYRAPEGYVLCATDFDYAELVGFAQSCYTRFGFSVMRDVINAHVDPHRWFAGVREGVIDCDTSKMSDPKYVEELNALLKKSITKASRQVSKAVNFGLPGGMSANRLYTSCREQGTSLTPEFADTLRREWIGTFPEMRLHMQAEEMPATDAMSSYDVPQQEEEDEEEDVKDKRKFKATLINGMVRTNCSFCSALNIQFQGLVAYGVKLAMWNLAMHGYLPRIVNMVHDELLYLLRPDELDRCIPEVEELMKDGMRKAMPDVRVGVETSVMRHWDKGATVFSELSRDEQGNLIIEEPSFVKEAMAQKQ